MSYQFKKPNKPVAVENKYQDPGHIDGYTVTSNIEDYKNLVSEGDHIKWVKKKDNKLAAGGIVLKKTDKYFLCSNKISDMQDSADAKQWIVKFSDIVKVYYKHTTYSTSSNSNIPTITNNIPAITNSNNSINNMASDIIFLRNKSEELEKKYNEIYDVNTKQVTLLRNLTEENSRLKSTLEKHQTYINSILKQIKQ